MDSAGQVREFRVKRAGISLAQPAVALAAKCTLARTRTLSSGRYRNRSFTMQRTAPTFTLRPATEADMESVQRIYGDHVAHGLASFEEALPSVEEMLARFRALKGRSFPYIVAEQRTKSVAIPMPGPIARARPIVSPSRISVYVDRACSGQGIGRALLSALILECKKGPWRQMIAIIGNSGNSASIALHKSLGFRMVGTLREVGFKHDQWVDTVLMQRCLTPGRAESSS
jgi:L-amino acid N-acyltransferase YncA